MRAELAKSMRLSTDIEKLRADVANSALVKASPARSRSGRAPLAFNRTRRMLVKVPE
jgi:hypothetical protein